MHLEDGFRSRAAVCAALAALAWAGCGTDDGSEQSAAAPDYEQALAGAPRPLAALHAQADELLEGGVPAFERRLERLRGFPVVVNKWASWCVPCRAEFPYFQSQAAKHGTRVAFLGADGNDSTDAAMTFLRDHPVPYPSYVDPDEEIADAIGAPVGFPATAFYDADGKLTHTRTGQYHDEAELAADIRRYAPSD